MAKSRIDSRRTDEQKQGQAQHQSSYHNTYNASRRSHHSGVNNSIVLNKKKNYNQNYPQGRWQRSKSQNNFARSNYYNGNAPPTAPIMGPSMGNNNVYQTKSSYRRNSNHKNGHHHNTWLSHGEDKNLTKKLKSTLYKRGVFETIEAVQKRCAVLKSLEELLCEWSLSLAKFKAHSSQEVNDMITRVALISFGSFRLGVQRSGADLDALALSPPHCTRGDFFTSLVKLLYQDPRVTELHPIPGAYTPVIKFYMEGIAIDLLFARLVNGQKLMTETLSSEKFIEDASSTNSSECSITDEDEDVNPEQKMITKKKVKIIDKISHARFELEIDDTMLIGLDEAGVRSLNGVRVAQMILHLVPNVSTFRLTLRAVKEWALIHGLYSNVLGFLGGINWAILVAWVCKRNPSASAATILKLFFHTFAKWKWPYPVDLLTQHHRNPPPGVMSLQNWDPKSNHRDIMPIITPAYPSMNSSYNVGQPQLRRIQEELNNSLYLLSKIGCGESIWLKLFQGTDFFRQHMHYLQVDIIARNAKDFRSWFGLCESRMRILIAGLDSPDLGVQAYPYTQFFHEKIDCTSKKEVTSSSTDQERIFYTSSFFIALRFFYGVDNVDLKSCTSEFLYKVNAWEDRRYGMDLTINHVLQPNLPPFVFKEANKKERKKKSLNSLSGAKIVSSKDTDLPAKTRNVPILCDIDNNKETSKTEHSLDTPSLPQNPSIMKKMKDGKLTHINYSEKEIDKHERLCESPHFPANPSPMKRARPSSKIRQM